MASRTARLLCVVPLCLAVFAAPALANKPTIVYFEVSPPFTLTTAQTGCGFDIVATTTNSREKLTSFLDQDGNLLSMLITGVNQYLFTNASTGKAVRFNSSAPARLFVEPGDTLHAIVTGPAVLLIAPGAVPTFPTFAYTQGRVDMLITTNFVTLQLASSTGRVQDICQMLQ
jgi:hypothetical protein